MLPWLGYQGTTLFNHIKLLSLIKYPPCRQMLAVYVCVCVYWLCKEVCGGIRTMGWVLFFAVVAGKLAGKRKKENETEIYWTHRFLRWDLIVFVCWFWVACYNRFLCSYMFRFIKGGFNGLVAGFSSLLAMVMVFIGSFRVSSRQRRFYPFALNHWS